MLNLGQERLRLVRVTNLHDFIFGAAFFLRDHHTYLATANQTEFLSHLELHFAATQVVNGGALPGTSVSNHEQRFVASNLIRVADALLQALRYNVNAIRDRECRVWFREHAL
jgi:hypothetical protein